MDGVDSNYAERGGVILCCIFIGGIGQKQGRTNATWKKPALLLMRAATFIVAFLLFSLLDES